MSLLWVQRKKCSVYKTNSSMCSMDPTSSHFASLLSASLLKICNLFTSTLHFFLLQGKLSPNKQKTLQLMPSPFLYCYPTPQAGLKTCIWLTVPPGGCYTCTVSFPLELYIQNGHSFFPFTIDNKSNGSWGDNIFKNNTWVLAGLA